MKLFTYFQPGQFIKTLQCLGLVTCLCAVVSAGATMPGEERILHAPMPDQALGVSGQSELVYRVQSHGHYDSLPDNKTALATRQEEVRHCVKLNADLGLPSNPPQVWPEYFVSLRLDTYASAKRLIQYARNVNYTMMKPDCSFMEQESYKAILYSSKGQCQVDLLAKTATGVCDASAHADAGAQAIMQIPLTASSKAAADRLAADPRYAAMFAKVASVKESLIKKTGQTKIVAGVKCDVWNTFTSPEETTQSTVCVTHAGSFMPVATSVSMGGNGVIVEDMTEKHQKIKAVDVKLDFKVSTKIFAPYLDAGFSVNAARQKK